MPDWLGQSKVAANGIGTVLLHQNNASTIWEVEQVSVSVGPASTSGNVVIYKNGNLVAPTSALAPQVSAAGIPSLGQTADGLPYVYINASDELEIVVSSATANDQLTVRAQYREFPNSDANMSGR